MTRTLEAHDRSVREIFEGAFQFEIPDYQRPYAWTTEQTDELFGDLLAAMRDERAGSGQYFLGSIVLIKTDRAPRAFVVDGQQRLTTLTILFAALRAAMPNAASDITEFLYRHGKTTLGEENQYRLIAREEDADFFRLHIQEPGGIEALARNTEALRDSQLRYRENATLLLERVLALSEADRTSLWRFIATACSLVVISTPDLDAAYRIFSVLNNRGLDLAAIDILKAVVLGAIRAEAGEEASRAYARRWSEIEQRLGREAFGDLFVHLRALYAKQKQRATLVKELEEHVADFRTPRRLMDDVISPYAEVWDFIKDADFEATQHAETINEHLRWLNRLEFNDWVPPALLFFKRFRQRPAALAAFLRDLERLTYFLLVTKAGINVRIDTYAALTREIEEPGFDGDAVALTGLQLTARQRLEFVSALDSDIYTRLPKARLALLLRLEALMSDGSKEQEFKHVSIEHVLPQTPPAGSEWLDWFPDEEEREAWTHRLANLVPLHIRKNPAAGNFDFARKRNVYFLGREKSSPFILTNEIRTETEWTPERLAKRQKALLQRLITHWRLAGEEDRE